MNYNTQTFELAVNRDGEPDADYYAALERAKRIETAKQVGYDVLTGLERAVKATGKGIGTFAMLCYQDSDMYRALHN